MGSVAPFRHRVAMDAAKARALGWSCCIGVTLLAACGGSEEGQRLSSSGGTNAGGVSNAATSSGGASSSGAPAAGGASGSSGSGGVAAGVCPTDPTKMVPMACADSGVAAGDGALIDDFESDDLTIEAADGRSGGWFLYNDKTGTTSPDGNAMGQPEPAPLPTARGGSTMGIHFSGAEHVQTGDEYPWGGGVGLYITPQCYDASAYTGVSFYAKGSGTFVLAVGTFEAQSCEFGGLCTLENCVANGKEFTLSEGDDWTFVTVPWDELSAGSAAFDVTHVGGLTWGVKNPGTPATPYGWDLWIDDVRFTGGTAGGSGGANGSMNEAGAGG